MTKKILLDQDGVLANFVEGFQRAWFARGLPDFFAKWDTWDFFSFVPADHHKYLHEVMCAKDFFGELPVMPGAVEAVDAMLTHGHKLFICSTPWDGNDHCVAEKLAWLRRHFGKTIAKHAIFTHDKTVVHGDLLVDDKPEIVGAHAPSWEHVVYHWPYNAHVVGRKRLYSWDDWRDVLHLP